uniref:Protein FAM50 homolog n=2 Tax=Panagrolaimus sp. JU765 TaxID=591449 RepID=A0AC34R0X1_9BILA
MSAADFGRLIHLSKKRERAKEDAEKQKQKLEDEAKKITIEISEKFTPHSSNKEEMIKASTVGLVTLDEMKQKNKELLRESDHIITGKKHHKEKHPERHKSKDEVKVVQKRILSFNPDEEEEETPIVLKKRVGMDPTVDTSFLPDKERELETIMKKEELVKEWRELQEKEKNDQVNVSYCYWDGSGHRKDMK